GVYEKHDHPVLALVIVPDMARVVDIPVGVPNPVALNDFRGRPKGDFGVFDRDVGSASGNAAYFFHLVIIEIKLGQITVAVLIIAVGAVPALQTIPLLL